MVDYPAPAPLEDLWLRTDQAAVFMCGLPYSLAEPRPVLIAAPVPSPAEFLGAPQYWSDFVVRKDSAFREVRGYLRSANRLHRPGVPVGLCRGADLFDGGTWRAGG